MSLWPVRRVRRLATAINGALGTEATSKNCEWKFAVSNCFAAKTLTEAARFASGLTFQPMRRIGALDIEVSL